MIEGAGAGIEAFGDRPSPAALTNEGLENRRDEFHPTHLRQETLRGRHSRLVAIGEGEPEPGEQDLRIAALGELESAGITDIPRRTPAGSPIVGEITLDR